MTPARVLTTMSSVAEEEPTLEERTKSVSQAAGLAALYESVQPRLELVERFIAEQLQAGPATVQQAGTYVLEGGGKRIRPATLLVVARMLGYTGERDVRYGGVIEMIHTATLVHDDIIDHATLRRGRASANQRWGNNLTVLLGDWLYTRSMELALEVGDVDIMRVLSRATIEMIEGEILGLELRGHADVTMEQYLEITRRKTAELFSAACSIPALFSQELRQHQAALAAFGRNLGFCFQIVDDMLDVTASQARLGKPVFSDLCEGTMTLPFILLLPRVAAPSRKAIGRVVAEGAFDAISPDELRRLLDEHGVIEEVRTLAGVYGERATAALASLPASPERDSLALAPELIARRDH